MFEKFNYHRIALSLIRLDLRNPRIVTQSPLTTEDEIIKYLFEHEGLREFLKKIAFEGRNEGAERPYLIKSAKGKEYTVVEGNTRISTYKLLTGQLLPPAGYEDAVPAVSQAIKDELASVDCAIAPNRDALLPIMASAHFGRGDKVRWSYLGSRKAVFDEHKAGKSIAQLANAFGEKQSEIKDYLLEYELYQECLKFSWTPAERDALEDPAVAFNPPVRFLQTTGHKQQTGIDFDRPNLKVTFADAEARNKLEHLVRKLVVHPERGMGATSSYKEVFADYVSIAAKAASSGSSGSTSAGQGAGSGGQASGAAGSTTGGTSSPDAANAGSSAAGASAGGAANGGKVKKGALFNYPLTRSSLLMEQLMKEAATLNCANFPGAGTALLRSIVEAISKRIIEEQNANSSNKLLSLESAISICLSNAVSLPKDDKKILKEFGAHHLDHVNMSTHATVKPNYLRLRAACDCIDDFVRRNV